MRHINGVYTQHHTVEVKKQIVQAMVDYPWSSYPAYINQHKAPDWLERETTYQMLGSKQR